MLARFQWSFRSGITLGLLASCSAVFLFTRKPIVVRESPVTGAYRDSEKERELAELEIAIKGQAEEIVALKLNLAAMERSHLKNIVIDGTETLLQIKEPNDYEDLKRTINSSEDKILEMKLARIVAMSSLQTPDH